jgi:hypothetical protein
MNKKEIPNISIAKTRKLIREDLRKKFGNKKLAENWRLFQIKKYGKDEYEKILKNNTKV